MSPPPSSLRRTTTSRCFREWSRKLAPMPVSRSFGISLAESRSIRNLSLAERAPRWLARADLIGFHIRTHCSNFLATVDRALEALTDWDRFEIYRQGRVTRVRPYPISVAAPLNGETPHAFRSSGEERAALCEELGIEASLLGVGVDRVDYTKGILERFRGIERFLENYPAYLQRFSFVQIGAPSRTDIPRYKQFLEEVASKRTASMPALNPGVGSPSSFSSGTIPTKRLPASIARPRSALSHLSTTA